MSANAATIEQWNETLAGIWLAREAWVDRSLGDLLERTREVAAAAPGERILDVGCGTGGSALRLARAVAPGGRVLGVDVVGPFLERARLRAGDAGLGNLSFVEADAQEHAFDAGSFDLVFSRFGVMFFADPVAAFANLARALRPGGRIAFVCWQALANNPWFAVPLAAVGEVLPLPKPEPPGGPGPFGLADAERTRAILERAGFEKVVVEDAPGEIALGGLDEAVETALSFGPGARLVRAAGGDAHERVVPVVRNALRSHLGADGVRLGCAAWIVSGRVTPA